MQIGYQSFILACCTHVSTNEDDLSSFSHVCVFCFLKFNIYDVHMPIIATTPTSTNHQIHVQCFVLHYSAHYYHPYILIISSRFVLFGCWLYFAASSDHHQDFSRKSPLNQSWKNSAVILWIQIHALPTSAWCKFLSFYAPLLDGWMYLYYMGQESALFHFFAFPTNFAMSTLAPPPHSLWPTMSKC